MVTEEIAEEAWKGKKRGIDRFFVFQDRQNTV